MGKLNRISEIGVWPRWLCAAESAIYCGISESTFYERVRLGFYPQGFQDGELVQWDRHDLDEAKLALKKRGKIAPQAGKSSLSTELEVWTPASSAKS